MALGQCFVMTAAIAYVNSLIKSYNKMNYVDNFTKARRPLSSNYDYMPKPSFILYYTQYKLSLSCTINTVLKVKECKEEQDQKVERL